MKSSLPSRSTIRPALSAGRRRGAGFSLVEVVLALGVFTFSLVSILGLISVSLGVSRASVNETRCSAVAQAAQAAVQSELATNADFLNPPAPAWQNGSRTYWFDANGVMIDPAALAQAYYRVDVTLVDSTSLHTTSNALRSLLVNISYPVDTQTGAALAAVASRYTLLLRNQGYRP